MKKLIKTVLLTFLLISLVVNISTGANKRPKPILPKAKTVFSTSLPSSYTQGVTRSGSDISKDLTNELSDLYNQIFITPELAKVYSQSPVIEWSEPVCSSETPCKMIISDKKTEITIFEEDNIKDNSYVIDLKKKELLPEMVYLFKITQETDEDSGKIDQPLQLYVLSKDEKDELNKKLSSIQKKNQDDEYTRGIKEINFFVDNGLWFELTEKLKQMITQYPDDTDLTNYKNILYKLNTN
ncbi:MAG: hypothetical protein AB7V50_03000 [Vampirovibrionia bacterium]